MTAPTPPGKTRTATRQPRQARALAGDHARLMRDVSRRAGPVLTLLEARVWPHAELGTLTAFLSTSVIRQVTDEEAHLFPADVSLPSFARLRADHVRLRTLTTQLQGIHRGACPPPALRAMVDELLATLRRHLADEEQVIAGLHTADGQDRCSDVLDRPCADEWPVD